MQRRSATVTHANPIYHRTHQAKSFEVLGKLYAREQPTSNQFYRETLGRQLMSQIVADQKTIEELFERARVAAVAGLRSATLTQSAS